MNEAKLNELFDSGAINGRTYEAALERIRAEPVPPPGDPGTATLTRVRVETCRTIRTKYGWTGRHRPAQHRLGRIRQ